MTKERLQEILSKVENHLALETRALRADLDSRMPNIVLENRKKEVKLWEDLADVVRLYIQAIDLDIITDEDPIKNLTSGPRIYVDDEGVEHWNFGNAVSSSDEITQLMREVVHSTSDDDAKPMQNPRDVKVDMVNSPNHYATGRIAAEGLGESIETIDYLYDKLTPEEFKGGVKWNALKYLSREGHKDTKEEDEDMRKAVFYLNYYLYHKKTDGSKELK